MQTAGFIQIWLGLESGSQTTLKNYRKRQTVDQGRKMIIELFKLNITLIGFLMIAGPESTVDDILMTLELAIFLIEHGGDISPDVAYGLISREGTTQMRETRRKNWDFSYIIREFIKFNPFNGQEIKNLIAEGGYVFPQDLKARILIRTA